VREFVFVCLYILLRETETEIVRERVCVRECVSMCVRVFELVFAVVCVCVYVCVCVCLRIFFNVLLRERETDKVRARLCVKVWFLACASAFSCAKQTSHGSISGAHVLSASSAACARKIMCPQQSLQRPSHPSHPTREHILTYHSSAYCNKLKLILIVEIIFYITFEIRARQSFWYLPWRGVASLPCVFYYVFYYVFYSVFYFCIFYSVFSAHSQQTIVHAFRYITR